MSIYPHQTIYQVSKCAKLSRVQIVFEQDQTTTNSNFMSLNQNLMVHSTLSHALRETSQYTNESCQSYRADFQNYRNQAKIPAKIIISIQLQDMDPAWTAIATELAVGVAVTVTVEGLAVSKGPDDLVEDGA